MESASRKIKGPSAGGGPEKSKGHPVKGGPVRNWKLGAMLPAAERPSARRCPVRRIAEAAPTTARRTMAEPPVSSHSTLDHLLPFVEHFQTQAHSAGLAKPQLPGRPARRLFSFGVLPTSQPPCASTTPCPRPIAVRSQKPLLDNWRKSDGPRNQGPQGDRLRRI